MSDAPEHIWLQRPCRDPENEWFGEITWCDSPINDDDTEYVRADKVIKLTEQLQASEAVNKALQDAKDELVRHLRSFAGQEEAYGDLIEQVITLCGWIREDRHAKGCINGLAAQVDALARKLMP